MVREGERVRRQDRAIETVVEGGPVGGRRTSAMADSDGKRDNNASDFVSIAPLGLVPLFTGGL